MHRRVAHVVRARRARARGAQDRGRERVRRSHLRARRERQDARDLVVAVLTLATTCADGLDRHDLGLPEQHRAPRAQHGDVGRPGALEGARILVGDAAREGREVRARIVQRRERHEALRAERHPRGRHRREHLHRRGVRGQRRDADEQRRDRDAALDGVAQDARGRRGDVDPRRGNREQLDPGALASRPRGGHTQAARDDARARDERVAFAPGDFDGRAVPRQDARLAGRDDRVDPDDLAGLDDDRLAGAHVGRRELDRIVALDRAHAHVECALHRVAGDLHAIARSPHGRLDRDRDGAREPCEHRDGHGPRIGHGLRPPRRRHRARCRREHDEAMRIGRIAARTLHPQSERPPREHDERDARRIGHRAEQADRRREHARDDAKAVDDRRRALRATLGERSLRRSSSRRGPLGHGRSQRDLGDLFDRRRRQGSRRHCGRGRPVLDRRHRRPRRNRRGRRRHTGDPVPVRLRRWLGRIERVRDVRGARRGHVLLLRTPARAQELLLARRAAEVVKAPPLERRDVTGAQRIHTLSTARAERRRHVRGLGRGVIEAGGAEILHTRSSIASHRPPSVKECRWCAEDPFSPWRRPRLGCGAPRAPAARRERPLRARRSTRRAPARSAARFRPRRSARRPRR